jgi:hypothetical protein
VAKLIHFRVSHAALAVAKVLEPPGEKRLEKILHLLAESAAAHVRARVLARLRAKRFQAGARVVRQQAPTFAVRALVVRKLCRCKRF